MASIDCIEGIGDVYGAKLRDHGIRTCEKLLDAGRTRKGRKTLASVTGLGDKRILEWVNRADLMRVRGVSTQYSDLLEAAGVDTVKELRQRNASNLCAAMEKVNARKKLVRRTPPESVVTKWVAEAKQLRAVVTY